MKHNVFIVALLALLLIVAGGVASADASKSITGLHGGYGKTFDTPWFCLYWNTPTKTPLANNSFRVDWSLNKRGFRSHKQENTKRAGHIFTVMLGDDGAVSNTCWDIGKKFASPVIKWPVGQTLRVRIRARYSGANGPWTKLSVTRTADGFTSSDITLTKWDPPADEE